MRLLSLLLLPVALACTGCPTAPCADTLDLCLVAEDLGGAILSVRTLANDDVWMVGTEDEPDTSGPTLLHYDGQEWESSDLSEYAGAELWWTWPAAGVVTAVGSQGLIIEVNRSSGEVTRFEGPPPEVTFFGVWGAAADDVWAVGGAVGEGTPPVLWRRDGAGWSEYISPDVTGAAGSLYFKVHGTATDDVWFVGDSGVILHWDGVALEQTDVPADLQGERFLTVDVGGPFPVAVGGLGSGTIVHWDGTEWTDQSPEFSGGINGVCTGGDRLVAVGNQGSTHEWDGAVWQSELSPATLQDYHGCAIAPSGDLWAVGGQIVSRPLNAGVIAFEGEGGVTAVP